MIENVISLAAAASTPDPFDPASLRLDQSFTSAAVKKLITTVSVGRPHKQDFIRAHRDPEYRLTVPLLELGEEKEMYVVKGAEMVKTLAGEWFPAMLQLVINRQGVIRLWPVKLPTEDGKRGNKWPISAAECVQVAMEKWVRVVSNMSAGCYEPIVAEVPIPEPEWPDLTMTEILKVAFRDRLIEDPGHPAVQRLRGRV
jgi:hypothetical protein